MDIEIYQEIKWKIRIEWDVKKRTPMAYLLNKWSKRRGSMNFWIRQQIIRKGNSALTNLLKKQRGFKNGFRFKRNANQGRRKRI